MSSTADYDFIFSCLRNTKEKPNFEEVAKECGLANKDAAYKRHWALMKKHGLAGNSGKGRKPAARADTTPTATPKKRGRKPKKPNTDEEDVAAFTDDEGGDTKTPSKKSKATVVVKLEQDDTDPDGTLVKREEKDSDDKEKEGL